LLPRRQLSILLITILLPALSSLAPTANAAPLRQSESTPPTAAPSGPEALTDPERELYDLINEARAKAGLPPLILDDRLVAAAREHSADMAQSGRCRHKGSDGSLARQRIVAHGYPANNWTGENIKCSTATPQAALRWWLRSSPHRRNILHRHYTHIGVGVDPNGPWGPDWTLNFAAGSD
jgi:uncharacterized protein YkwD